MKNILHNFWQWYERNIELHTGLAASLFVLQLIHLYWLFAHVVLLRLVGTSYFNLSGIWNYIIIFVDYVEIPTLISVSLLYINELRKGFSWKPVWFLIFLNSQWLHIFWITDEFVIGQLTESVRSTLLPLWLAWVAIGIDYLELPVIFDTSKKAILVILKKFKSSTKI